MATSHRLATAALATFLSACAATSGQHPRNSSVPPPAVGRNEASTAGASATTPIARRSGFAVAPDGTHIYYEVCGAGPAIVFVHGLGGNHAVWFQQVAHFAKDHTVVTLSQRGFAPSGGDGRHYDPALLVRDLEAVMDAASVTRATVVGQSMGGWTALGLAMKTPDRVAALVLADTTGGIDDDVIAAHMREVTAAASRLRGTPPPLGVHPALSPGFSARRPDLAYLYQTLTTFGSPPPDVIAGQLAAARVLPAALERFGVPTLFVVGAGDKLFPPSLVRRAAGYIKDSVVAEIGDAGHSPYFERPDAWNAAVSRFVDRP